MDGLSLGLQAKQDCAASQVNGNRAAFLLVPFLWPRKEKELVVRGPNPAYQSRREATQQIPPPPMHLLTSAHPMGLISSMQITEVSGTLQKRQKSTDLARQARLKAGSLDSLCAMDGFLPDRQGPAQDALLDWIYKQP